MKEQKQTVVLFVDDDDGLRSVYSTILRNHGYAVLEAASATEAQQLVEGFDDPIEVLLMDINLPDGFGATLAQRLSELHPEMQVVYTTGFAKDDPILESALNDAPRVLKKPFNSRELVEMVERALAMGG